MQHDQSDFLHATTYAFGYSTDSTNATITVTTPAPARNTTSAPNISNAYNPIVKANLTTTAKNSMDSDENESSKSTPFYTPMEYMNSPFEFPTPPPPFLNNNSNSCMNAANAALMETFDSVQTKFIASSEMHMHDIVHPSSPRLLASTSNQFNKHLDLNTSPAVSRKFRRFSLYERRSCSPQQLIIKSATSVESSIETDKENTIPAFLVEKLDEGQIGNHSPNILKDENMSPRIVTNSDTTVFNNSRLVYSPKLLASINNLNLNSPLRVISSAGYKNGNYFKFPEIDRMVQEISALKQNSQNDLTFATSPAVKQNDTTCHQLMNSVTKDNQYPTNSTLKNDNKGRRKNKNNLTIRINSSNPVQSPEMPVIFPASPTLSSSMSPSSSSPKPKTPTIKSTKEKALSLDSASSTQTKAQHTPNQSTAYTSCEDGIEIQQTLATSEKSIRQQHSGGIAGSRSLSLSQLTAQTNLASRHSIKTIRPRLPSLVGLDGTQNPRKAFGISKGISGDNQMNTVLENRNIIILTENDNEAESDLTFLTSNSSTCASTPSPANLRTPHKHNPLLHNSNTNLKTLPEFLTLVEFSTTAAVESPEQHPFKQRSMDLPSATVNSNTARTSNISSTSNLLQRRGSNHSLTLNLHGSCSNLLGNCRTGLSVSNYSLASVSNSNNNTNINTSSSNNNNNKLDFKSTCNLSVNNNSQQLSVNAISSANSNSSAGMHETKQSLFRRRGSNNNLLLTNVAATSCGNLNTYCSQNALNIENNSKPAANAVTASSNRRGLLERRGSNQNLTLNMSSSSSMRLADRNISRMSDNANEEQQCNIHTSQRKFFSSESLNHSLNNQSHRRNTDQMCFGSVNDLKLRDDESFPACQHHHMHNSRTEQFDFEESSICTCTSVRNIMTKPLSPQTTSEEFKVYLANIQMLQNATNALNQNDLIRLNHMFDSSYVCNLKDSNSQSVPLLDVISGEDNISRISNRPSVDTISEDNDILERYSHVVQDVLAAVKPDIEEQKQMFRNLHKEFWDLPLNHQEKPMVFGSQTKNRYKTILPNENSRVLLDKLSKLLMELVDDYFSNLSVEFRSQIEQQLISNEEVPYINANYIKGPDYTSKCCIATQGPLPNTIYDFWLMIYQNIKSYIHKSKAVGSPGNGRRTSLQQYCQKIIMLTNFAENNRQKCSIYFPIESNDILIITPKEEAVKSPNILKQFFDKFLLTSSTDKQTSVCIENLKVDINSELVDHLPASLSFFVIKNVGIRKNFGYSIRKFVVLHCTNLTHLSEQLLLSRFVCYHYWYPDWPDHRSPRDINTLLDISIHVMNLGKCELEFAAATASASYERTTPQLLPTQMNAQPIDLYQEDIFNVVQPLPVIHCSAGIGRTGCMTAILNGLRQIRQSLAYSLTSMAAKVTKAKANLAAKSLVDYCLPEDFLQQHRDVNASNCNDCSFSRNTLLYIKYILQVLPSAATTTNTDNEIGNFKGDNEMLTLADLPQMPNIFVDVLGIVCNLRLQRGGMVQNSEQYELIHRAICLYLKRTFALKRF